MKQSIRLTAALGLCFLITSSLRAEEGVVEEVVVTGSYISGSPEDAELPIDVINRDDLEDVGTPTLTEFVRNLYAASGNIGETNQFQAGGQANEGVATINLRGLGSARTLVLINGKRHVATETQGVDLNAIPTSAIGRLEILKDGAAALYGSDAIGGVVNIITRDFEGFEVGGSFMDVQDSDGDWDVNAIFGLGGDNYTWTVSAEYGERSELPIRERDWALQNFGSQPQGGWSGISNPGNILALDGSGVVQDPQCQLLGAYRDSIDSCGFQYTFFDNLIEDTETYKVFTEFNYDINETTSFHVEAMFSEVDLPDWKTSPSYPPQSLFGPDRIILDDHPGLVDLRAQNPTFPQTGAVFPITRARGVTGKGPGGEPEDGIRNTKTYRFSAGLDGTLFNDELNYDVSVSWSKRERELTGNDMFIENMAFASRGLGGPNCDRDAAVAAGAFGVGDCLYYNPFSNAIERSVVNGAVNPQFNPAVANPEELMNWLISDTASETENELLVFEAIFSGETGLELGAGNVGWAAGVQSRRERYDFQVADIGNRALNPCPWTDPLAVTLGFTTTLDCAVQTGRLAFLAATDEESTSRRVYGIFAELALPFSDTFNMQAAIRYEDYGGTVGSTIDPKIAASWQVTDQFSVRASASTTFRGPPQSFLSGTNTALQFIPAANAFKAVDIRGNSTLEPESAVTTNIGLIYQNESFYGSIDWWRFDFQDSFQTESAGQIISAYSSADCADGGTGVGTSFCDAIRSHVFPTGVAAAGVERTETNIINGEDITTSGIDFFAQYDFMEVAGGTLSVGVEGVYVLEYESDDFLDINGITLAPGGDFVGFLNDGDPFTPKPEIKGNTFVRYRAGNHMASVVGRYTDSYEDVRPALPSLSTIDDHFTVDFHYNYNLNERGLISLSVINVADEDPPIASTDLNYDAFTHSAFGRMIKLSLRYALVPEQ